MAFSENRLPNKVPPIPMDFNWNSYWVFLQFMAWHGIKWLCSHMFPIQIIAPSHRGAVTMQLSAPWPLQAQGIQGHRWTLRTRWSLGNHCELVRVIASYCELLRVIEARHEHMFSGHSCLMLFSLFMNKVQCRTGGMADVGGQTNWNTQRGQMNCGVGQTFKCWDLLRKQLLFRTWFHSWSDPLLHAFTVYQLNPSYVYSLLGLSMSPRCLAAMATWIYNSPKVICKTAGGNVLQVQIVSLPSCVQVSISITWIENECVWMCDVCVCTLEGSNVNNCSMLLFTRYASWWCMSKQV